MKSDTSQSTMSRSDALPPPIRAVFLDAGFTLLEPIEPVARTYIGHAERLGVRVPEEEFTRVLAESWKRLDQDFRSAHEELRSSEELERLAWHRFTRLVAGNYPELEAIHEAWLDALFGHFDHPPAWRLLPGTLEGLDRLRAAGLKLAIVSNWHSALHAIVRHHGVSDYFEFVLTSAEAGYKKPHAAIYREALARLDVEPSAVVHVGDSWEADAIGSSAVGIRPVLFDLRRRDPTRALPLGDPVPVIDRLGAVLEHCGVT